MSEYMDYNEWLEDKIKNLEQQLKETREFFVDKCKEIEEQNKIINDFREQNFELREDLGTYKNKYHKLFFETFTN